MKSQQVMMLLLAIWVAAPGKAQTNPAPPVAITTPADWPREVASGTSTITYYQPQLDEWRGNQLTGRVAVGVRTAASGTPTYGVLWFTARTEVDKAANTVTLNDLRITRAQFPPAKPGGPDYAQLARNAASTVARVVPLEQVEASLAVGKLERQQTQQPVRNEPPRIFYSTTPAILVLIDGPPVLRAVAGTNLRQIINTRALLLLDAENGRYYLRFADRWLEAPSLETSWQLAKTPPAALETVLQALDDTADPLDDPNPEVSAWLASGTLPRVFVSTMPAELLRIQGKPDLQSIEGTHLLWARNSTASLFLNTEDQRYYLLLSGRWFRTRSLENGPWEFVSRPELPRDFARIPENHPAGDVLSSVPGTPQAEQAVIANSIPQTATVRRDTAQLTVEYDGAPQFQEIPGTRLRYAVNSATPVIQVTENGYYACESGVWFTAASPEGPWTVASSVPPEIYTIPPSSPLHFVTNTYVYGSTPAVVYTGYTPGYLGTYLGPYGTVVYGSGYRYSPWIGTSWFGGPLTYGLGAAFDWSPVYGWGLGFGWGAGPVWRPWWGPWRTSFRKDRDHDRWRRDRGHWRWREVNLNRHNFYNRWDRHVVPNQNRFGRDFRNRFPGGVSQRPNNVFAGPNGRVFRRTPNGWEIRDGTRWRPENRGDTPVRIPPPLRTDLNRDRTVRSQADQLRRMQVRPSLPNTTGPGGRLPNRLPQTGTPSRPTRVTPGTSRGPLGPGTGLTRPPMLGTDFGGFGRRSGLSSTRAGVTFGGRSGGFSGRPGGLGGRPGGPGSRPGGFGGRGGRR